MTLFLVVIVNYDVARVKKCSGIEIFRRRSCQVEFNTGIELQYTGVFVIFLKVIV